MAIKTEKIILDLRASVDQAIREMKGLKGATTKVNKELSRTESLMKKAGTAFVAFFAISKVAQWGKAIGDVIADFQKSMSGLSSITGAVGEDLDFMRQKAIDLSVQLKKTASEVVKAFQLVGSAKPELLKNAAALAEVTKQAIILSQAAGMDVPEAAKILTGALNLWQKGAKDAAKFTDILADSQKKGSVLIRQIGESLINAGSTAAAVGLTFEDVNVIIQAFGKGMLEGARAGTATDIVLRKLSVLADKELNPAFTDMGTILENLKKRGYDEITKASKLVGEEGAKYLLTLIAQRGVVQELTGNLGDMGIALEQAQINTKNVRGAQDLLTASWEAVILTMEGGEGIFVKLWQQGLETISHGLDRFRIKAGMSFGEFWELIWNSREELKKLEEDLVTVGDTTEAEVIVTLKTLSEELKKLKEDFMVIDIADKAALESTSKLIKAKQAEIKVIQDLIRVKKEVAFKIPSEAKEEEIGVEPWMLFGPVLDLLKFDLKEELEGKADLVAEFDKKMFNFSAKLRQESLKDIRAKADAEIQIEGYKQDTKLAIIEGAFGLARGLAGESFIVQKLLAIAESIISTFLSAQYAYASQAWIPGVGPALAKAAKTNAIIGGLANTAMIVGVTLAGLEEGGFTGNAKYNLRDIKGKRIAGFVHEDEFVFNQQKTAALRPFFEDIHHDRIDIRGLAALTRRGVMTPIINSKLNADILEKEVRKIYQKMSEEKDNSSEIPFDGGIMKRRGSVTTIIR